MFLKAECSRYITITIDDIDFNLFLLLLASNHIRIEQICVHSLIPELIISCHLNRSVLLVSTNYTQEMRSQIRLTVIRKLNINTLFTLCRQNTFIGIHCNQYNVGVYTQLTFTFSIRRMLLQKNRAAAHLKTSACHS